MNLEIYTALKYVSNNSVDDNSIDSNESVMTGDVNDDNMYYDINPGDTINKTNITVNITEDPCKDHIEIFRDYDPYTATVCALYLVFGVVCAFFGYRCFKALMFLTGFIFGSIIVYLICAEEAVLPEYGNAGVALSAGLLFGLVTMLVQYVGLFMLGFHTGLLLGLAALCGVELYYIPQSAWLALAVLLASGLVFSLFNLYFQKSLTIFGSSLYGGAVLATATDYFLQSSRILQWVWERVKVDQIISKNLDAKETLPQCWIAWVIFAIWPFIFIMGIIVQGCCTGRGIYHEESLPQVKYSKRDLNETKEERKQRKYRYLYQVRMCHGDVISQVNRPISGKYVQHLDDAYA